MSSQMTRNPWLITLAILVGGVLLSANGCKDGSPTNPDSDLTEVFPLAVGSRWVYDYTYHGYDSQSSYTVKNQWQQGTITFSVQSVAHEWSQLRWTVRERDSLRYTDTTRDYRGDIRSASDSTSTRDFTFSVIEAKDQLHELTSNSNSVIWLSPVYNHSAAVLSRYVPGSVESYLIHLNDTISLFPYQLHVDSLLFVRDRGLVRDRYISVWASSTNRHSRDHLATLREYTAGQGAAVGRSAGPGRDTSEQ